MLFILSCACAACRKSSSVRPVVHLASVSSVALVTLVIRSASMSQEYLSQRLTVHRNIHLVVINSNSFSFVLNRLQSLFEIYYDFGHYCDMVNCFVIAVC